MIPLLNPPGNEVSDMNWRSLIQATPQGTWNPTPTLSGSSYPTISGTNVLATALWRQSLEGILYFNVTWTASTGNTTVSFAANNYIILPKACINFAGATGSVNNSYLFTSFGFSSTGTNTVYNLQLANATVSNGLRGIAQNQSGSTESLTGAYVSIQGWYFVSK
jgi:hypothetical protein